MQLQKTITGFGALAVVGTGLWAIGLINSSAGSGSGGGSAPPPEKKAPPLVAKPLIAQADRQRPQPDPNQPPPGFVEEAIVIPECRLGVIDKIEVPAPREGVLLYIGRPILPGEKVLADRLDRYLIKERVLVKEKVMEKDIMVEKERVVKKDKAVPYFKRKAGDRVEIGDILALVDNRLAIDERTIKEKKLENAKAELAVSISTREEAKARWNTQMTLDRTGATNKEDVRAARLAYEKYFYEVISKTAAINVADSELSQTDTVVDMHEIVSKISGRVETIYKQKGEAVKSLEPLLLIHNLDRLRAEGMVDVQNLPRLEIGTKVLIEPTFKQRHFDPFIGHTQAITGVAVSKDPAHPLIASSSEDGTVRVWKPNQMTEHLIFYHAIGKTPLGVRCVACTPPGSTANWCLTGANDGGVRLWDLDGDGKKPLREFEGKHQRAVNCLAFNQDGSLCASGGEDREIRIWETATGQLKVRLTDHHGQIESLQFTPQGQLVSAAKDRTIMLWNIGDEPESPEVTFSLIASKRSDDVPVLGISPDGKRFLYDPWQCKDLRVLTLEKGLNAGVIRNPSGTAGFKTLALFSPDGKLILTGSATEGKLQLWQAPTEISRAHEVRELVSAERFRSTITCAAFYPHPQNGFVVAGTKDRQVLAWPLPSPQEIAGSQIPGEVSYIERSLDSTAHQVRIWAEFENPKDSRHRDGILTPGDIVNVVVPSAK